MSNSKPTGVPKVRRKAIRFRDESTVAAILNEKVPVLAFSESSKGCGLAVLSNSCPSEGEIVNVRLGTLGSLKGVVRWKKQPCEEVSLIGIEYT